MIFAHAILIAMVLGAAITDLLEQKIYNLLTFPAIVVGVFSPLLTGAEWWRGVAGLVALGGPFFLFFAFNVIKAADVKLLMAIGAWLGLNWDLLLVGVGSIVVGGILSLVTLILAERLGDVLRILQPGASPEKSAKAPFGLAIALASIVAVALRDLK